MKIQNAFRRLLAGSLVPILLGLPIPSAAATPTPQQALNDALKNAMTNAAGRVDMTARIGVEEKPYARGAATSKGSIDLRFQARTISKEQSEGRFVIAAADLADLSGSNIPLNIAEPLAIQWKMSDGKLYVRLEDVPQPLLDLAKEEMDLDLGLILGRWIVFDLGTDALGGVTIERDSAADLIKRLSNGDATRELRLKAFFARTSILQVTRVEKRMKNAAGEDVWRLRVRVNPAVVNFLYQEALRDLPKSGAERTTRLRKLNADFANARRQLARTAMAVNVNVAKKRIERLELGGRYPEIVKTCVYDAKGVERCTNTGTRTITVAIGLSMFEDAGGAIDLPFDVLTPEQASELLFPSLSPSDDEDETPVGDINFNDEIRFVAPGVELPPVDAARDHILGSNAARVTLVTYSDFQCPFCARFAPTLRDVLDTFPVDVRLVYRHFPLDSIHPEAQKAAEASECAAKLGGNDAFWRMHDKLFDTQAILGHDAYVAFARQLDLDESGFVSCLDSGEMAGRVREDAGAAVALGLQGTPTSFVNGLKLEGALPFSILYDETYEAGARR